MSDNNDKVHFGLLEDQETMEAGVFEHDPVDQDATSRDRRVGARDEAAGGAHGRVLASFKLVKMLAEVRIGITTCHQGDPSIPDAVVAQVAQEGKKNLGTAVVTLVLEHNRLPRIEYGKRRASRRRMWRSTRSNSPT